MRLLVTGSSGYLASLLLPRLAADPEVEELLGLDVREAASPPPRLRHLPGSVLDAGLASLLERERVDVLLHLAWIFNPTHDRAAMRAVDVEGTKRVFEAALRARVGHVIYLSSTTAYGAHPDNPPRLLETSPTRGTPGFPYSAEKAEVEGFLREFLPRHPELGSTILRPCIILGRRTDNFVRAILGLPLLLRIARRDPEMQFLHEDDLVEALERVLRRRPQGVFNLVPQGTLRMSELGAVIGRPVLPLPGPIARAVVAALWALRLFGAPPSYLDFIEWPWVADGTRLREAIGFLPRHSTREALEATRAGRG